MRPTLRQLETFRAVVESGSMTESGRLLGISQPAVSRQIGDLESLFGVKLFARHAGRIEPTKDAMALLEEVERCLADLEQLSRLAGELGKFSKQRLRIASVVGHSYFLLPRVIEEFHQLHPDVTISLRSGLSSEVIEQIEKGQSDIGFALLPLGTQGVAVEPMPEMELVCVMPQHHPLAALKVIEPQHLADVPLMLISENSLMRKRLLHAFTAARVKPKVILESTYTGPICSLVGRGMGVSVVDHLTAEAYLNQGIVIRSFSPAVPCELKLVTPLNTSLSQPAQAFIGVAKGILSQRPITLDQ